MPSELFERSYNHIKTTPVDASKLQNFETPLMCVTTQSHADVYQPVWSVMFYIKR